jgi:hypothetical protein
MKTRVSITTIIALLFIMAAVCVDAQDSKAAASKELTIEELFLKSIQAQVMREKAFSEDYEVKMSVLDDIDKMITDNSLGDNAAQIEFVLEYLSMEGTSRTVREDRRQINNFPEVRRRASNMLGRIGGPDAVRALITVLLGDNEPMVKAEAAYGLGTIGLNENNEAVAALGFAIDKEDPTKPDNNFAFAVCLAIEKLGQKTQGTAGPIAYRALVKIAQGNYRKDVKAKAYQVLDVMGKQGR